MWQENLTYVVLIFVLIIVCYRVYKYVKNPHNACTDCSSNCNDCKVMDLKKEIEAKKCH